MSETDALKEQPQDQPSHSQLAQEALSRIRQQINADLAQAVEPPQAVPDGGLSAERAAAFRAEIELARIAREAASELEQALELARELAEIRSSAALSEQRRASESGLGRFLLQYVVTPLAIALIGGGFGIGAAEIAADSKSESSTTCMQDYATALEISKDHPTFRLPDNNPDQQRCDINAVLEAPTPTTVTVPSSNAPTPTIAPPAPASPSPR